MKNHFETLHRLSAQNSRRIIGLMSGTSLDGLDVALCRFTGAGADCRVQLEAFETIPYDELFRREVRRIFARREIDFQHLVLLNVTVAERHAAIVLDCLKKWKVSPAEVDLLASHGQTVFHAPRHFHHLPDYPNATLQIGDGDHLARRTGIITLSDFRQKHLAAGGEGAPLALYGDYFLFSKKGEDRFLLNIGGIANFTFLPGDLDPDKAFATDTGPGNTLLDHVASARFGVAFDEDSRFAKAGTIDNELLDRMKNHPYFQLANPKTTGPEMFGQEFLENCLQQHRDISAENLMATLTRFTAETIAEAVLQVETAFPKRLYLSGGGAHNPMLVEYLRELLPGFPVDPFERLGISGDAKEAVLFAALANETLAGRYSEGQRLGGIPLVSMGKISLPG